MVEVRPNLDTPKPPSSPDSTAIRFTCEHVLYEQGFAQFADGLGDFIGQLKRWSHEDIALPRSKAAAETLSRLTLDLVRWLAEITDHRPNGRFANIRLATWLNLPKRQRQWTADTRLNDLISLALQDQRLRLPLADEPLGKWLDAELIPYRRNYEPRLPDELFFAQKARKAMQPARHRWREAEWCH